MSLNFPQNLKFKRYNRRFVYGGYREETRVCSLLLGSSCGLVVVESGFLTRDQLLAAFKVLHTVLKPKRRKRGQKKSRDPLLCSVALRAPVTVKPIGSRMGRGKGGVDRWICPVRKGRVLFQVQHPRLIKLAVVALVKASFKLPVRTRVVLRQPRLRSRYLFAATRSQR